MKILRETAIKPDDLKALKALLGDANVSVRDTDRAAYSRDLWPMTHIWMLNHHIPHPPDAIVWVASEEQVAGVLALARERNFPVIPFAAGSGVCGGTLPRGGGVVMDLKKMNSIFELNDATLTVTAEAGIIGQHLEMELNRRGYTMGHFPSSIYCSSLGGFLATRSAGQLSAKYGKIEDMALSVRCVMADGKIVQTVNSPRSAAGPDFAQLLIGSEGTLGVITSAVMKIYPYPEARLFRGFVFNGIHDALESMRLIMRAGVMPAAVRLYDELDTVLIGSKKEDSVEAPIRLEKQEESGVKKMMHSMFDTVQNVMLGVPKFTGMLAEKVKGKCLLVLTFEGDPELARADLDKSISICIGQNGTDEGEEPAKRWWENRYNVSYNASRVFDRGSFVDTIEVATTWDKVEDLYYAIRRVVSRDAFIMAHFSHVYVHGCSIYFSVVGRGKNEEDALRLYRKIWDGAMDECARFGATVTHHHGVGIHKAKYFTREMGALAPLYHDIKNLVDPGNVLNPGKMGLPERQ